MATVRSIRGYEEETMIAGNHMMVRRYMDRSVWMHWNDDPFEAVSPNLLVMDDFGNLVAIN